MHRLYKQLSTFSSNAQTRLRPRRPLLDGRQDLDQERVPQGQDRADRLPPGRIRDRRSFTGIGKSDQTTRRRRSDIRVVVAEAAQVGREVQEEDQDAAAQHLREEAADADFEKVIRKVC